MEIFTTSHLVENEPHICHVPVFHTNRVKSFTQTYSPSIYKRNLSDSHLSIDFSQAAEEEEEQHQETCTCLCPHVLIADDDHFQHFYYQNLFQRSLDYAEFGIDKDNLCVDLSLSGEELLKKLSNIIECGCSKLRLVIVDYDMSSAKLNGVETICKIRQAGYKGHVLLRTSETIEFLETKHANFEHLLQEGVISKFVSKCDLRQSKAVIQRYIER